MAKKHQQFTIIVERDEDDYFIASVPALPGCHTQAKTINQLKERIREAITLCLDIARQDADYRKQIKRFSYKPVFVGLDTIVI